ncbi:alpha/beta fold hydrolase [Nocardia otitidiscaviarum]|uniref:alpha/beta fold hydrolase n=1 Tax=Nocardia otitidiscaviarum TaxID=1823 RepID=UPI001895C45B|nr:alpha/beta fold hydrolase [Nocardia otitidiscaviarum]MBF6181005.1 alpha/beta fold hydrolase [Nocardia otitidiscaviarum]
MSNEADHTEPTRITFRGYGGIDIAGDSWGPTDAPLVVFLHGGGQTRHSWKDSGLALAKAGLHAVLLDARGHGDSDWAADGDYRRDAMVGDLMAVLAQLDKPAFVVGASMGGLTGLLATAHPERERITGLVLVDVVPRPERAGVERVLEFLGGHREGFATVEEAADAVAEYLPHRRRPRNPEGLLRNLRQRADGRWYWHWDPAMMSRRGAGEDIELHSEILESAARDLTIPVLLVRGALSDVVSEQGVAAFRALVPHADYTEIGTAAHTAASDANDEFTDAVVDFVRAHVDVD